MPFPTSYNPYNFKIIHRVDAANKRTTTIERVSVAGRSAPEVESVSPTDGSETIRVVGNNLVSWDGIDNEFTFTHVNGGTTGTTVLTREQILAAGGSVNEGEALIPESLVPDETLVRLQIDANNTTSALFVII